MGGNGGCSASAIRKDRIDVAAGITALLRAGSLQVAGDNGSAFLFRLHSCAKSAMAEILVSNLCDCRPPLLIGGLFHCHLGITRMPNRGIPLGGDPRAAPSPRLPASNRTSASPGFSDCSGCSAHCFFHCLPLFLRVDCTPVVRHETRDWLRSQQLAAAARRPQAVAGFV